MTEAVMDRNVFLGDAWAPVQTLDFYPPDNFLISGALDGPDISIKPETLAYTQTDGLHNLEDSLRDGCLDNDWMEQSQLEPFLDLCEVFMSTPKPVQQADEVDTSAPKSVSADEFLQEVSKPPTPPPSPEIQVIPEFEFSAEDGSQLEEMLDCKDIDFLKSPLSTDDVESVLSSACSPLPPDAVSPVMSPPPVDITDLCQEDSFWTLETSELYKVVRNSEKPRETPYSRPSKQSKNGKSKGRKQSASISPNPSELELELMSKKDRKKLQNKNAAIRYRMKKKAESEEKKNEVDELEEQNQALQEKVEDLTRQVKCMKDLINEVRKARGLPPAVF